MDRQQPPSFDAELADAKWLMEMLDGGPLMLDPRRFPIVVHESEAASALNRGANDPLADQ